ncbi:hypothetical protein TNCV_1733681 [Trichonephila clavipes]|nr:hypothetical protein TNCV_1733681 [Trichonephila clavipes]
MLFVPYLLNRFEWSLWPWSRAHGRRCRVAVSKPSTTEDPPGLIHIKPVKAQLSPFGVVWSCLYYPSRRYYEILLDMKLILNNDNPMTRTMTPFYVLVFVVIHCWIIAKDGSQIAM